MNKIVKILILVLYISMSSCDSFLDVQPRGVVIPTKTEEFAALLNGILEDSENGNQNSNILASTTSALDYECSTDNLDANLTIFPAGRWLAKYIGDIAVNSLMSYKRAYENIRDANIIIDNLKHDGSKEADNIMASVYALRGVSYYNLMRLFCESYDANNADSQLGLSIATRFDMEARPKRASIKQTVEQIVSDFQKALEYKPENTKYIFSEDVINSLLAKTFFWAEDWDNAIRWSEKIADKYPLLEGKEYVEMINSTHQLKGNQILRANTMNDINTDYSYSNLSSLVKFRPVSREFVELFTEKNDDIRYRDSLLFNSKRENLKPIVSTVRSAEMFLIIAESYAHKGNTQKALEYLNMIRAKRIRNYKPYNVANLPEVKADALIKYDAEGKALDKLMSAILEERQKELFMEGDRIFELKRNGSPEFWVGINGLKYVTQDFMYTFPIPYSELVLIDGMIQNKGYEK